MSLASTSFVMNNSLWVPHPLCSAYEIGQPERMRPDEVGNVAGSREVGGIGCGAYISTSCMLI